MYYEKIKKIRKERKITQKDIADKLKIKHQQYQRYETGKNIMPVTYLKEICELLNVSSDYILGLCDDPKPLR